ncbi:NAD-binding protein [Hydrogenophaga sp.]|uniref:NAD-binding protein n=1 Tax=Hydrogenophaga sp. TaxID=1904254 RepID=UPI003F71F77D
MGPVGCGMATKACNQMLNYGTGAVVAETLNFAARFGIDPALIPEAVAGGFADSNVLRHYGQHMVAGTYRGNTLTAMKDIDIIMDLGRLTGSAMPVTGLVASFFRMQIAQGYTTGGLPTTMRMYAQGPLKAAGPKDNGTKDMSR